VGGVPITATAAPCEATSNKFAKNPVAKAARAERREDEIDIEGFLMELQI
jgi:hypothetical protein